MDAAQTDLLIDEITDLGARLERRLQMDLVHYRNIEEEEVLNFRISAASIPVI